jgi:hypothetical protein
MIFNISILEHPLPEIKQILVKSGDISEAKRNSTIPVNSEQDPSRFSVRRVHFSKFQDRSTGCSLTRSLKRPMIQQPEDLANPYWRHFRVFEYFQHELPVVGTGRMNRMTPTA